jgi:hypothetical protein
MLAAIDDVPAPHPAEHFSYGLGLVIPGIRAQLS